MLCLLDGYNCAHTSKNVDVVLKLVFFDERVIIFFKSFDLKLTSAKKKDGLFDPLISCFECCILRVACALKQVQGNPQNRRFMVYLNF